MLDEVSARSGRLRSGEGQGGKGARGAARSASLLCQMVEHRRGSRVEDYRPLFEAAASLVDLVFGGKSGDVLESEGPEEEDQDQEGAGPQAAFERPSLARETLRLLTALVYAHARAVGASAGLVSIAAVAPTWAPAFAAGRPADVLRFSRALITPPGGADVARLFAPHILAAGGGCVLRGAPALCVLLVDQHRRPARPAR